ncbi:hypothetical protein HDZ31DRAFT_66979 [Schizophyllum fasciatum]
MSAGLSGYPTELLQAIFGDKLLLKADLAQLCLVSTRWNDVAMPQLWESLNTLQPLLALLTEDAYHSDEIMAPSPSSLAFLPRIDDQKWARTCQNFRLVKTIDIELSYRDPLNELFASLLQTVSTRCHLHCLFPNLRRLRLGRQIHGHQNSGSPYLLRPLLSASVCCDALNELALYDCLPFTWDSEDDTSAFFGALRSWMHLRIITLRVFWCCPDLLSSLSLKENLESLDIDFESILCHTAFPPDRFGFTALKHLSLRGVSAESASSLVRAWRFPKLESLSVMRVSCPNPADLQCLLQSVQDSVSNDNMRSIRVVSADDAIAWAPLRLQHMAPLAPLRGLTTVVLHATDGVRLTNDEHAEVAGWWPNIEILQLHIGPSSDEVREVEDLPATLAALAHYAWACRNLRDLRIPLTTRCDIPELPADLCLHRLAHPLSALYLGVAPLFPGHLHEEAIRYVTGLFPNLSGLTTRVEDVCEVL